MDFKYAQQIKSLKQPCKYATNWTLEERWFDAWQRQEIFLFSERSISAFVSTKPTKQPSNDDHVQ